MEYRWGGEYGVERTRGQNPHRVIPLLRGAEHKDVQAARDNIFYLLGQLTVPPEEDSTQRFFKVPKLVIQSPSEDKKRYVQFEMRELFFYHHPGIVALAPRAEPHFPIPSSHKSASLLDAAAPSTKPRENTRRVLPSRCARGERNGVAEKEQALPIDPLYMAN